MNKSYLQNTSGQFSIMLALTLSTLLVGVGAAIDFTGVTRMKSNMQNYADSAVLAAAATRETNIAKLTTAASYSIDGNNSLGITLKREVSLKDDIVRVHLAAPYQNRFMGIFGKAEVPIQVIAESPMAQETKVNIALVLDSTYSMEGANMTSLKEAAVDFVEMFKKSKSTQIGIVPFSDYVNVGTSNKNANWLTIMHDNVCKTKRTLIKPSLCQNVQRTGFKDGRPVSWTSRKCPSEAYEVLPKTVCEPAPWNGCVGSRPGKWHKRPAYDGMSIPGLTARKYKPAVLSCGKELMPLTSNTNQLKTRINSLHPSGETYIPSGLIWGWRLLDESEPFADISNSDKDRQKIMVFMTDGSNTKSLSQPHHEKTDGPAADALSQELCSAIKQDGIIIYSVAYKLTGSNQDSKSIIKGCASSPSNFYDAQNAQELKKAFKSIGKSLFAVRLSH